MVQVISDASYRDIPLIGETYMSDIFILIVDDKPQNLFTLEKILASVPATIIKANSGEDALTLTLSYDFALAILDVQMPLMDGYELASFLLGDPNTSRIPIIFLSAAYADEQHAFKGYEKGAVDYIVKPFEPEILLSKVNVFLELARYRIQLQNLVEERTQALLEEEKKLRLIIDNTPDCILNLDRHGIIKFINAPKNYKSFIGYSVYELFDDPAKTLQAHALSHVFETRQVFEFESNMKLAWYPTTFCYSHRLAPIIHDQEVIGCVQISRDISEIKLAEQARIEIMRAEAENQAKSKFLAGMSHEIRTPMNAILGYAQLLRRETSLSSQQQQYLEVIDSSGEHLLGLIDSVLDMAKIESGRMTLAPSKVNFFRMLIDMEKMFRLKADEKKLQLHLSYPENMTEWILVDANKVRQVLINLLSNALKFTEKGVIELRAGIADFHDDSIRIFVEVEDSGCGIEMEKIDTIFDAFEQASAGKRNIGAGLGLSVSSEFARMLQGSITVKSEVNIGSVFRFEFCAKPSGQAFSTPRKIVSHLHEGQGCPHILVVDDDSDNLQMLGDLLSVVGFTTQLSNNGSDAIRLFEERPADLVIVDFKMEGMLGNEVAEAIRKLKNGQKVPILMLTASPLPENHTLAIDAGVDEFLVKPIREENLFKIISHYLDVQFHYLNDAPPSSINSNVLNIEQYQIDSLPMSLKEGLRQALYSGYLDEISDWIDLIASDNPILGQQLHELAQNFKYPTLLKILSNEDNYYANQ